MEFKVFIDFPHDFEKKHTCEGIVKKLKSIIKEGLFEWENSKFTIIDSELVIINEKKKQS